MHGICSALIPCLFAAPEVPPFKAPCLPGLSCRMVPDLSELRQKAGEVEANLDARFAAAEGGGGEQEADSAEQEARRERRLALAEVKVGLEAMPVCCAAREALSERCRVVWPGCISPQPCLSPRNCCLLTGLPAAGAGECRQRLVCRAAVLEGRQRGGGCAE